MFQLLVLGFDLFEHIFLVVEHLDQHQRRILEVENTYDVRGILDCVWLHYAVIVLNT